MPTYKSLRAFALGTLGAASLLVLAAPLLAAGPDTAQGDVPALYSHLLPLTVSGLHGVAQLKLPRDVYLRAHSANLHDLRVFDADGKAQRYALSAPQDQSQTSHRSVSAKVFPVYGERKHGGTDGQLEVRASIDGRVLSVKASGAGDAAKDKKLSSLVLDLRQPDGAPAAIDALTLTPPPGRANYSASVELEVSDDLKQWESLGQSQLSWMTNTSTQHLASDRITFDARSFRYARLSWVEGEPVEFAGVSARLPLRTDAVPAYDTLELAPRAGKFGNDLVYRSAIALPVRALGLKFSAPNVVYPVTLGSYVDMQSRRAGAKRTVQFQAAFQATFYQLSQAGKVRSSGDLSIEPTHTAEWVLRPQAGLTDKPPVLRVSWLPASLVFVAGGRAPYTLAVGRSNAPAVQLDASQVAPGFSSAELAAVEHAVAGPMRQQTGVAALAPAAGADGVDGQGAWRKKAGLWGALLFGVAVLGAMSYRLMRQMSVKETSDN